MSPPHPQTHQSQLAAAHTAPRCPCLIAGEARHQTSPFPALSALASAEKRANVIAV